MAAVTSRFDDARLFPTEVRLAPPEGGLTTDSVVLLNQLRSVDRRHLVKRLGRIQPDTLADAELALRISLGLVRV